MKKHVPQGLGAVNGKQPYRHVSDTRNAQAIEAKQKTQGGAVSPHPRTGNVLPPVKRTAK